MLLRKDKKVICHFEPLVHHISRQNAQRAGWWIFFSEWGQAGVRPPVRRLHHLPFEMLIRIQELPMIKTPTIKLTIETISQSEPMSANATIEVLYCLSFGAI